jgi:hypothetical protein
MRESEADFINLKTNQATPCLSAGCGLIDA